MTIDYNNINEVFQKNVDKFFSDGGDDAILYNFNLNENSIVFDLGSFEGEFYTKIYDKYNCYIHAFEPVKEFFEKNTLKNNKIKVNNFALGKDNNSFTISQLGNCSSSFLKGPEVLCNKVKFSTYLLDNNINKIDLIKINIEGGEYELIEEIIEYGFLENIQTILVQFHNLGDRPIERRGSILKKLSKTHKVKFNYDFVWECFDKNVD